MSEMKLGEVFMAQWVSCEDGMPHMDGKYGIYVSDPCLVHVSNIPGCVIGDIRVANYWKGGRLERFSR